MKDGRDEVAKLEIWEELEDAKLTVIQSDNPATETKQKRKNGNTSTSRVGNSPEHDNDSGNLTKALIS